MEKHSKAKMFAVSFVMAAAMTGTAMAETPNPEAANPSATQQQTTQQQTTSGSTSGSTDCDSLLAQGKTKEYTDCEAKKNGANTDLSGTLKNVLQVVIGLVGILSVVMIIYGGIQYTTSVGDAQKVTKAKNTILYAIIGLIISLLSFAIVTWVLGNVGA